MEKKTVVLPTLFVVMFLAVIGSSVLFYYFGLSNAVCHNGTSSSTQVPSTEAAILIENNRTVPYHHGRLPRHLKPVLYKIEVFPNIYLKNPDQFSFVGKMWLQFQCLEQGNNITLNVDQLKIADIEVGRLNTSQGLIQVLNFAVDTEWQFLTIFINQDFLPGNNYYVEINYNGPLKSDYTGLYVSTIPHRTRNQHVAATQFSPTDARKAFPCFDEPDRKARFEITIIRRADMVSLSNMPKDSERRLMSGAFVADAYQTSPVMSTYLVAFAVGDLSSLSIEATSVLNFTSWASIENIDKTRAMVEFGANVLKFYEGHFEIPFPLPKQDMLVVPETAVGAMENWGLIIFKEDRICYDDRYYSEFAWMDAMTTVAHELAHQWFGNLATPNWWGNLFLKEAFATYFELVAMQNVLVAAVNSSDYYNFPDYFTINTMHPIFETDGLMTSHPVHMSLSDSTEIKQVFDSISYLKGASLIRMMEFFLGPSHFLNGLKLYLQRYEYSNADHDGFFASMESDPKGSPNVGEIMRTWVLQPNYPVVHVTQIRPGYLRITQSRFLNDLTKTNTTNSTNEKLRWTIPFTYTTDVEANFTVSNSKIIWLEREETFIIDKGLPDLTRDGHWLIGNVQQKGYYRVNYGPDIWGHIAQYLIYDHSRIHKLNRAQIINDAFSLSKAKLMPLETALSLFEYLLFEDDYVPWSAAISELKTIARLVHATPLDSKFKIFANNVIKYALVNSANSQGTFSNKLLYAKLFAIGCKFLNPSCVTNSRAWYGAFRERVIPLPLNIRPAILCTVMKRANVSEWEFIVGRYNASLNTDERQAYLYGMTCAEDPAVQDRLIRLTQDSSTMKGPEAVRALTDLAANPTAIDKVWNHLTTNWCHFLERFAGSLFQLSRLVSGVTAEFTTHEQVADLKNFLARTSNLGTARRAFEQGLEAARDNARWVEAHYETLNTWLYTMLAKHELVFA
ncbi:hypothetical protein DPMN_157501 [Dreissena polymorpha]|uniref:Aminopeptidase n=3 Tax=Dreissena polymorpha TaxID=45954 RepID=A0A9D4EJJ0_DREPO|nr:hypothetical protein DPMN_157501 [Dreissena polymorpha]